MGTPIENNTAALNALLEKANSLPDVKETSSAPVTEKDVNFWDYDGTLLHSYTLAEAQALTELPAACVVEVPAASLEAYQNAANYSGIAAQMIGV